MRCQSCGQPLGEFQDPSGKLVTNFGTNPDNTPNEQYCSICFVEGRFTQPDMTLEKMSELSVEFMTSKLGIEKDKAQTLAKTVLPTLKRWQKTS